MVHHKVLGLPGGVAGNQDDNAERFAADLSRVVLEEAVVAVGAGEPRLALALAGCRAGGLAGCASMAAASRWSVSRGSGPWRTTTQTLHVPVQVA